MNVQPKKHKNNAIAKTQQFETRKLKDMVYTMPCEGKGKIASDVNGSYTGTPMDFEQPTQDADDL